MNAIGTIISTFTIILDPLVKLFSSSLNFFLLNSDFSIEEKTFTILPPVWFSIVSDAVKYAISSSFCQEELLMERCVIFPGATDILYH
mgnify:CR=1 FL=1